ncbi:MAG: LysE family translocator [Methanospirillum sp.]|uniref:LysE family transporter n=1 Tax=Methanospirillum sp. TaxID=45200 RepID=UPI00236E0D4F|nr:LysE family transporter [Methanospirillum sp.]MDD1730408.1 LysE family translocator [Methanospirillum sp.]
MSVFELAVLGYVIGLTGALAPGPTLIATIQSAIRGGWKSGPQVTGGHIIAEFVVVILIAAGIPFLPAGSSELIAVVGGVALVVFGVMTIRSARNATLSLISPSNGTQSPLIAGLVTSIANPYFWIWWFSVGSALLISSLASGIFGLIAFIIGHWLSDLSWFTLVSLSIHKSRTLLGDREYMFILYACGVLLMVFGIWFILSGAVLPGMSKNT